MVTSSASSWLIAGKIDGIRRASIDLPKPGDIGRRDADSGGGIQHTEILVFEGPRAELVTQWADRMNARATKLCCACGCGTKLLVLPRHRSMGLPRYLHGHHPNPLRRAFEGLRKRGCWLVSDVAKALGVSATTLRRMEAAGAIPKAERVTYARGKEARVYTVAQVRTMVRAKAASGGAARAARVGETA